MWPCRASDGTTASDALLRFIEAAVTQRNELVLPLRGGPPTTVMETLAARDQVHRAVQRIIERGCTDDGTISQYVSPSGAYRSALAREEQLGPSRDMPRCHASPRAGRRRAPGA